MAAHDPAALLGLPKECLQPVHFQGPRHTAGGHTHAGNGRDAHRYPQLLCSCCTGAAGVFIALFANQYVQFEK